MHDARKTRVHGDARCRVFEVDTFGLGRRDQEELDVTNKTRNFAIAQNP